MWPRHGAETCHNLSASRPQSLSASSERTCMKPSQGKKTTDLARVAHKPGWQRWRFGGRRIQSRSAPHSHTLAELLKLDPLVHAKPGWVNRDYSVVGLERTELPCMLSGETPHSAAICSSVTNDSPPHVRLRLLPLPVIFPAACFLFTSVVLLRPSVPLIYHVSSLRIVCRSTV